MRKYLALALVASLSFTGSAVAFAAQASKSKSTSHAAAEKTASGTVKSIDATSIVLKAKGGDKKFTLDPGARKDGVAAGSHVMVHYKTEGKSMVATSVVVEAMPPARK